MNKLIFSMMTLCSMFPSIAMEQQHAIVITQEENKLFVQHAQIAVAYSHQAVKEHRISSDNALHIITNKYPEFLLAADNNLTEMIKTQGLSERLEEFKKFELDELVIEAKNRLMVNEKDTQAKRDLTLRRNLLAGLNLENKQPSYSKPLAGEVQTDARINFMMRNKDYSLDDEAIKDYVATLIYQYILARRIII